MDNRTRCLIVAAAGTSMVGLLVGLGACHIARLDRHLRRRWSPTRHKAACHLLATARPARKKCG